MGWFLLIFRVTNLKTQSIEGSKVEVLVFLSKPQSLWHYGAGVPAKMRAFWYLMLSNSEMRSRFSCEVRRETRDLETATHLAA